MKTFRVVFASKPGSGTVTVTAIVVGFFLLAVCGFTRAPQGLAQDDAEDPTRGVENVPIERIRSMIDSTPGNQLRNPTEASVPAQRYDSTETAADWSAGHSLVLIEGSMDAVPLTALDGAGNPQPEAEWKVIRNPSDKLGEDGLRAPPYPDRDLTITPAAGTKSASASLTLDAVGSFSVVAYIDTNNDDDFSENEHGVLFNVVVSRISFTEDDSEPYPENIHASFLAASEYKYYAGDDPLVYRQAPPRAAEAFGIVFGSGWGAHAPAVYLKCCYHMTGGGPDGMLGLERVFVGWIQNVSTTSVHGVYDDQHSAGIFLPDSDLVRDWQEYVTIPLPIEYYRSLTPPLGAARPLLDSSGDASGGDSICLRGGSESLGHWPAELGYDGYVTAIDVPGGPLVGEHPKFTESMLRHFTIHYVFTARAAAWTQAVNGIQAGSTLYMCLNEIRWRCFAYYNTFDWNSTPHTCNAVSKTIQIDSRTPHVTPVRFDALHAEVMPPVGNRRITLFDASQ